MFGFLEFCICLGFCASDFEFSSVILLVMPVIKQAIKKVRQDKRKTAINALRKTAYKKTLSAFRKSPSADLMKKAYAALDRAAKTNVIHQNKASRLKSRLSKMLALKSAAAASVKSKPVSKSA